MTRHSCVSLFILLLCSPTLADAPDAIKPGIDLAAAKATLKKFGYDVNTEKYGLAMVARYKSHSLDFCPLDDHLTLVLEYQETTKKLTLISVVIIPEMEPKTKRCRYQREALEVRFGEDGTYWLKLKRDEGPKNRPE